MECEECYEVKSCFQIEIAYDDEKVTEYVCDDCYENVKAIAQLFGYKVKKK